jgi:hypothetical protein
MMNESKPGAQATDEQAPSLALRASKASKGSDDLTVYAVESSAGLLTQAFVQQ